MKIKIKKKLPRSQYIINLKPEAEDWRALKLILKAKIRWYESQIG